MKLRWMLLGIAAFAACDHTTEPRDLRVEIVAGDEQQGGIGFELADSLRVRVIAAGSGQPVEGVEVVWRAIEGAASLSEGTTRTGPDGSAAVKVQMPMSPGPVLVLAEVGAATATFRLRARLEFRQVTAGYAHSCALSTAGRVWCWGANDRAQLGDGSESDKSIPSPVAGGTQFIAITAGWTHTCGLTDAGDVFCWGDNQYGQLGNGDRLLRRVPQRIASTETFVSVSAGFLHTCAVSDDGTAYCWGSNDNRALGVAVVADSCAGTACALRPVAVNTPVRFSTIAAGEFHTCGVANDGRAHCWGWSSTGEIGNNAAPGQKYDAPVAVAGNATYTTVTAHSRHTCAVTVEGAARCWGRNATGETGLPPLVPTWQPTPVPGGEHFTSISTGNVFTCGVSKDARLLCWGDQAGRAGDFSTPVALPQPATRDVAVGQAHTCAIFEGDVWCWGANQRAQVRGPASSVPINTPTRVSFEP